MSKKLGVCQRGLSTTSRLCLFWDLFHQKLSLIEMLTIMHQRYVAEQSGEDLLLQGFHGKNTNPYRWPNPNIFSSCFKITLHNFREKSSCSVLWESQPLSFTVFLSNLKTFHQYLRNLTFNVDKISVNLHKSSLGCWKHWQFLKASKQSKQLQKMFFRRKDKIFSFVKLKFCSLQWVNWPDIARVS